MSVTCCILIALDSVGIDPMGHDRPESVYSDSRFLFPKGPSGAVMDVAHTRADGAAQSGILVETDVTGGRELGAIECAITYASIFSGIDALDRHGLMQGLGLKDSQLEELVTESNLFAQARSACLANAVFPLHFPFLRESYLADSVPHVSREEAEAGLKFKGCPVRFSGAEKQGLAELFTAAEINQNIFVYAARRAGVPLLTWEDVRKGRALTGSMTNALENDFDLSQFGIDKLPIRTPEAAAGILTTLAQGHTFTFYKYQLADLISHTGRIDLARQVFSTIEDFIGAVLNRIDLEQTSLFVTSDHGHLEQVSYEAGHPKSKVPTWYFGPNRSKIVHHLRLPHGIFQAILDSILPGGGSFTRSSTES